MLDHLRQVIGLRGYGQRDPLVEEESPTGIVRQQRRHRPVVPFQHHLPGDRISIEGDPSPLHRFRERHDPAHSYGRLGLVRRAGLVGAEGRRDEK